jgi:glycerate 2-kinase
MISAGSFWTQSLREFDRGESITRILAAAIRAVEPGEAVRRVVRREGGQLIVSGRVYDLSHYRQVFLLGIGKASIGMAGSMTAILGDSLSAGLVITKHIPPDYSAPGPLSVDQGGHPLPDDRSFLAGKKVVDFLSALRSDDLLFCAVSGGGSALASVPVDGLLTADLQSLTSVLLACGASIGEFNTLRRHLDKLKGGGIVRLANDATVVSLVLSDVVGNPLEDISSGPTAPDPTTCLDALALIDKYGLREQIPSSIITVLEIEADTPKPGDPIFEKVHNVIVGSNLIAAQAALKQAAEEGFNTYLLRTDVQGEASRAAFELATFLRQARKSGSPVPPPACILAGGETTVTVQGNGQGGRNTELALAAVSELANFLGVMLITLATDGEDGETDAAGAAVTGETYHRAAALDLHPGEYLQRNDSYSFFAELGDLLKPGPTGTNVNDLIFLFTL